jgi:hypothetical protein
LLPWSALGVLLLLTLAQDKTIGFALGLGKQDRTATGSDFSGDVDPKQYTLSSYGALELSDKVRPSIPTLNLTAGGGDDIAQPVGTEHTIDKAVGLAIGKTNLNAIHKTIGTKTAFLLAATGSDFSGDVDTKQYTLSSYGALELSDKGSIEAVLGVAKATHKVSKSNTPSVGMTLLSPLALSTRLIRLLVWLSAKLT